MIPIQITAFQTEEMNKIEEKEGFFFLGNQNTI